MDLKPILGQHHVSALTANAQKNYHFYTEILGLRLVKKTVNQDDTTMYHLFYADESGSPGTDLTFFEIKNAGRTYPGHSSISETALRVPNDRALFYWIDRFVQFGVKHDDITEYAGRKVVAFEDHEGQRLSLVSDENNRGVKGGEPWRQGPVPAEHAIIGLGPVALTVKSIKETAHILTNVLQYKESGKYTRVKGSSTTTYYVFSTGEGGTGAEIHVEEQPDMPKERPGRGSVHHVAIRVENMVELSKWAEYLKQLRIGNSGIVERYYFKSIYFRDENRILFELATDGPGFLQDEHLDTLGEKLALPPYLEHKRAEIEANLTPLKTS
ncbi:ring-cleaving dioxygenase [Cytobacillus gottheilii]|uniref:Ring-cleaving dioxygenase n=1 Tax=Cytobacillus gottheilii TaxID=859144 RepID=A0ABX8F6X0_9BACI|nr:ring-cleaving dioxygenase [Cytobacillus gottheilii]QVY59830.1 ring-cleaving dioxygenase [Cytobacillus gottheilii]